MRILKEDSAGVVIDIQERLLPHIYEVEQIVSKSLKLIEGLQLLEVPLIVTQQYTKGLGPTVSPVRAKINDFNPIEKVSFSCCGEPVFMNELNNTGRKYVIICGIESHVCVLQTCLDLLANGKIPVIVEDCVSSRKTGDKKVAIERMRQEGAVITTLESILFELTGVAGTAVFKGISGLVK
jgi:nicotinamidase-related amidase